MISRIDDQGPAIPGVIGTGRAMQEVYHTTRLVARTNASVLLLGETGTGKRIDRDGAPPVERSGGPSFRSS